MAASLVSSPVHPVGLDRPVSSALSCRDVGHAPGRDASHLPSGISKVTASHSLVAASFSFSSMESLVSEAAGDH